jgi:hypothetical protein
VWQTPQLLPISPSRPDIYFDQNAAGLKCLTQSGASYAAGSSETEVSADYQLRIRAVLPACCSHQHQLSALQRPYSQLLSNGPPSAADAHAPEQRWHGKATELSPPHTDGRQQLKWATMPQL